MESETFWMQKLRLLEAFCDMRSLKRALSERAKKIAIFDPLATQF